MSYILKLNVFFFDYTGLQCIKKWIYGREMHLINLNLDDKGYSKITTGLGFYHILVQLAWHGNFDLSIAISVDLHIDEHHAMEEIALALGKALP